MCECCQDSSWLREGGQSCPFSASGVKLQGDLTCPGIASESREFPHHSTQPEGAVLLPWLSKPVLLLCAL